MQDSFYITTPIYYINDRPHFGTAYTTIAADTLARYHRLHGHAVKFVTGTDEHGQKVEQAAKKAGRPVSEHVNEMVTAFLNMKEAFSLTYDDFIRTTESRHIQAAQHFWSTLQKRGYIYEGTYKGWYSVRDETFYHSDELIDGKAPTGAPVEWTEERSFFFRLSALQEPLLAFYDQHPDFILPIFRRNEVYSFVKAGLRDLSISRTSFAWGIPVPNEPAHIMYVWIEALVNYLTVLNYPHTSSQMTQFWPVSHHLIGKDILRFHAVYWPALLIAAGLQPPYRVFAHGWWMNEGQKMSKSIGNVVNPFDLADATSRDTVRYFMLREVPFGKDGNFQMNAFLQRAESELSNDFGNLAQRTLMFIQKNHAAQLDFQAYAPDPAIHQFLQKQYAHIQTAATDFALHEMVEGVFEIVRWANRYIDQQAPWALKKTDPIALNQVLCQLVDALRWIGILSQPILPDASTLLLDYLSIPLAHRLAQDLAGWSYRGIVNFPMPAPLFLKPHLSGAAQ